MLYRFGITAENAPFFYTAYAVYLSVQQPERLLLVTKWLYPEVAKHYSTTWHGVERGIRLAIDIAWRTDPQLLEKLAQHPLERKPTASKFLAIMTTYFLTEYIA